MMKEEAAGTIELAAQERDLLLELFAAAEKELLAEIGRTDTRAYRTKLENKLTLLERVRNKVKLSAPPGGK